MKGQHMTMVLDLRINELGTWVIYLSANKLRRKL